MARIPDTEIERLKAEVLLVPLLEAAGYALKAQGKCVFHAMPVGDSRACRSGCAPTVD